MSTEIHLDAEGAARWNLMNKRMAECHQKIARLALELEAAKADAWELEQLGKAFCEQYAPYLLESFSEKADPPCCICGKGQHEFESHEGQPPHTYSPV